MGQLPQQMYKLIFITNNNNIIITHFIHFVNGFSNRQYTKFEIFSAVCAFLFSSLLFSIVKNEEEAPHRWGLFLLFYSLIVVFVIVILYVSFSRFQRLNFSISTSHFLDLRLNVNSYVIPMLTLMCLSTTLSTVY